MTGIKTVSSVVNQESAYTELAKAVIQQAIEDFIEVFTLKRELELNLKQIGNINSDTLKKFEIMKLNTELVKIARFLKSNDGRLWIDAMNSSYEFISHIVNKKCAMIEEELLNKANMIKAEAV